MQPGQREACRRLIADKMKNGANVKRLLGFLLIPVQASVNPPRFEFSTFEEFCRQCFEVAAGQLAHNDPGQRVNPHIEQCLRENSGKVFRSSGSTAYQLAAILHGEQYCETDQSKRINLDSPYLRFHGKRCYFPARAGDYWKCLTTVHTVWEDSGVSDVLRAESPWGVTTFFLVEGELLATFSPASRQQVLNNHQGLCGEFDLWSRTDLGGYALERIHAPDFYSNEFAIHMQQSTILRIYGYARELVLRSGMRDNIPEVSSPNEKDAYKIAALELLDFFLGRSYYRDGWLDTFVDTEDINAQPFNIPFQNRITSESQLDNLMSRGYPGDIDMKQYQVFIATKIRRIVAKAAVYDDRYKQWGCKDGDVWIG